MKSGIASSRERERGTEVPRKRLSFHRSEAWRRLRKACIRRDEFRCMRCRKRFPYGTRLSPHHIIPRPEGGDYLENLASLCDVCHDIVEGEGFRTRFEIVHGVPKSEMEPTVKREFLPAEEVHDWQEIE